MVLPLVTLKISAIHALHALLILRNNYWGKWGQEVGTQRKHPFRHTKRGVYALEKKLISIITHHLLVRHAPNVVYRIISFVNLPILSVTTSGFHHCDARILCRNTHSSSRIDYVTILILYKESKNKILATLDCLNRLQCDKGRALSSAHVVTERHVKRMFTKFLRLQYIQYH